MRNRCKKKLGKKSIKLTQSKDALILRTREDLLSAEMYPFPIFILLLMFPCMLISSFLRCCDILSCYDTMPPSSYLLA